MLKRVALLLAAYLSASAAAAQEPTSFVLPPEAGGPALTGPRPDYAFAAYQRGFYITALQEAMKAISGNSKDAAAMTLIGELYRTGAGVKPSGAEAERWYRLAADLGDRQAQFSLGLLLLTGEGGATKDRDAARKMFEKAAAQTHAGALYNLGVMAIEGDGETKPDFSQAAEYFKRAAELGDGDAAYSYGVLLRSGRGAPLDTAEGAQWIKRGADAGVVAAEIEYAIMLFNGEGVDRDEAGAARFFGKAAARNNPIAQNRLAHLYATGRGVKVDLAQAVAWNMLASAGGVKDAKLDALASQLTPQQRAAALESVRRQLMF